MLLVVAAFGTFLIAVALGILVAPVALRDMLGTFLDRRWLWTASIVRLAVGALFILAADQSRAPAAMKAFGALFIVAGLAVPLLGARRIEVIAQWWMNSGDGAVRAWAIVAAAIGSFLVWAAL